MITVEIKIDYSNPPFNGAYDERFKKTVELRIYQAISFLNSYLGKNPDINVTVFGNPLDLSVLSDTSEKKLNQQISEIIRNYQKRL